MNFDRLCYFFVLTLLPILYLPRDFLVGGVIVGLIGFFIGIIRRSRFIALLGCAIAFSYFQVEFFAKKAENLTASKQFHQIRILQILKQQDYQTAIAENQNGQRLYLNWQAKSPLLLHAEYETELVIRPLSSRLNEGNFNRQKWFFAQKLQGTATVKQARQLPQTTPIPFRTQWLYRVKSETQMLSSQGLLLALAFGERAWLNNVDWDIFQRTSTAHIIAISGLHIALAFGVGFWLTKGGIWVILKCRIMQAVHFPLIFANGVGVMFAIYYSFLAGFAIPTWRALIAISAVLFCQYLRRHYTAWQLWWRVIALLLLLDPLALLSDSFWLSVLAVASLIFWYQYFPFSHWKWHVNHKYCNVIFLFLGRLIHLQLGIFLVFSPVQLYFFEGFSPYAWLANIFIVPLYSFVLVPLVLVSLLTDNIFQTWYFANELAQRSIQLITPLATEWQNLNNTAQWALLSFNVAVLLVLYGLSWKKRFIYWFWSGIVASLFYQSIVIIKWVSPQPLARWLIFDVGQGLAMALIYQTSGQKQAIFYDTGASWQGGSFAKLELLPYLRREGIEVTHLVISHDDNDHAGGRDVLLEAYPQAMLISSSQYFFHHTWQSCLAGNVWQLGDVHLQSVFPMKVVKRAENKDSCVLQVNIGKFRLLWTGDSGSVEERQYASIVGKIDFLQVGHHGSRTSTSQTLLAHTQPQYAMISSGRWNPWKHPHPQVTMQLKQNQVISFNTAEVGMIQVDFFPNDYQIRTARSPFSPWYQRFIPLVERK